jgi:hypothetical protein
MKIQVGVLRVNKATLHCSVVYSQLSSLIVQGYICHSLLKKFLSVCKEASLFVKCKIAKEDFYILQTG